MRELHLTRGTGSISRRTYFPNGGYDEAPDTFHLRFDPNSESATEAIVKAVSFVRDTEQDELDPIAHFVDPDALEKLVGSSSPDGSKTVEITFTYENLMITVSSDGDIWMKRI